MTHSPRPLFHLFQAFLSQKLKPLIFLESNSKRQLWDEKTKEKAIKKEAKNN